jgi:hypothetical protein
MPPRDFDHRRDRLARAGRRLDVHERHELRRTLLQQLLNSRRIDCLTRPDFEGTNIGTGASRHLRQTFTEVPDDTDDGAVARLEEIQHDRLESRRSGRRNRQRVMVLRAEHPAQRAHRLVHQLDEIRIEMSHRVRRHRLQDARVGIARPRPHEQTLGRVQMRRRGGSNECRFSHSSSNTRHSID